MRCINKVCALLLAGLVVVHPVMAGEAEDKLKVMDAVARLKLPATPDDIRRAGIPGFYEVRFGMQFLYVSADGGYIFHGDLLNADKGRNLSEQRRADIRMQYVGSVPESEMIIFEPKEVKRTITVFTDIDCSYCRRLHTHINDFLAQGIRVRYLLDPRAGVGSPSYKKAVSAWCADDRKQALTAAKRGVQLGVKECDNPVQKHMAVAQNVGVQGTPTILTEDGIRVGGYLSPPQMQAALAARPAANQAAGDSVSRR